MVKRQRDIYVNGGDLLGGALPTKEQNLQVLDCLILLVEVKKYRDGVWAANERTRFGLRRVIKEAETKRRWIREAGARCYRSEASFKDECSLFISHIETYCLFF